MIRSEDIVPPFTRVTPDGGHEDVEIEIDDFNFRDGDDPEIVTRPDDHNRTQTPDPHPSPGRAEGCAEAAAAQEREGPAR